VINTAKEMAGKVGEEVKSAASSVGQMASDAASFIGKKAESATSAVSDTVKSGTKYVQDHSVSDMAGDLGELIKRNPIPAILIAVGIGFLVARATRS
jgi:ElaB/YqjD/DUF883 family membrane-anchored ribosome-binding protein